jgi:hypothetical protein
MGKNSDFCLYRAVQRPNPNELSGPIQSQPAETLRHQSESQSTTRSKHADALWPVAISA